MKINNSVAQNICFCFLFINVLLLSACQPVAPTEIPQAGTATPTEVEVTSTPIPTSVPAFPLAGVWTGSAVNGNFQMQMYIEMNSSCDKGVLCGKFNIYSLPCAGNYSFVEETQGVYSFQPSDYVGTCSTSNDTLQILPSGQLQYISRGDFGETKGILTRQSPLPVFYDDDGSSDGTAALMYLLSDPRVSVKAATISYGEAYPKPYIQLIGGLLNELGYSDIPLGAGQAAPLGGDNAFPEWMRKQANNFWGMPLPDPNKTYPVDDAAQLMVDTINNSPEPMTLFISGPCTNLAEALRIDPNIKQNIKSVYIMGGAIYVPGNLGAVVPNPENSTAEWNIYADPLSAKEVFSSGLEIYLLPLDSTNQILTSENDTSQWRYGGKAANFAADLYEIRMGAVSSTRYWLWDIMAAEIMTNPSLCDFVKLTIDIGTTDGEHDGQTMVITTGEPNVYVCLQADNTNVTNSLNSVLASSQ